MEPAPFLIGHRPLGGVAVLCGYNRIVIDPSFEEELLWRGTRIRIAPIAGAGEYYAKAQRATLPGALASLIASAQRVSMFSEDLARTCDDAISHRLTSLMWERARALQRTGDLNCNLPDDVTMLGRALPPSAIAEVLAKVIAVGFEYDVGTSTALQRGSLFGRLGFYARRAWELMGKSSIKIATRALRPRIHKAVCLDYATAMQVLFFALKRATGSPANTFVVGIAGDAFGVNDLSHMWNWMVDVDEGRIMAFDVSCRGMRREPGRRLELAIELPRYRNVSGFLTTIIYGATRPDALWDTSEAAELVSACIDPETDRGQLLLFHIAEHPMTRLGVRSRLAAHLAAHDFARLVPAWHERLDRRSALLGRAGRVFFSSGEWELRPFAGLNLAGIA